MSIGVADFRARHLGCTTPELACPMQSRIINSESPILISLSFGNSCAGLIDRKCNLGIEEHLHDV
jgi:hypothetical protein